MKKRKCTPIARLLDKGVSLYAYGAAIMLVIYMLSTFLAGAWNFFSEFQTIIGSQGEERHLVEIELLAFIAFTIVMIKAYRILISYAKTQHVNIKYLTEIAIIAPAIEILFNSRGYQLPILILLACFGTANLIIYVWKYEEFKNIGQEENEEPL